MRARRRVDERRHGLWRATSSLGVLAAALVVTAAAGRGVAAPARLMVWDTGSALGETPEPLARTGWQAVPSDLLALEADPPKARSDPGYYGREYSLQGDLVVENDRMAAVFWSAIGRVVLFAKTNPGLSGGASAAVETLGRKVADLAAVQTNAPATGLAGCRILRHAADEVIVEVTFRSVSGVEQSARLSFDRTEIVEVHAGQNLKTVRVASPMAYAVVPGLIGDDLIVGPREYPAGESVSLPSEHALLGLLPREDCLLTLTWPSPQQRLRLNLAARPGGERKITSVDFECAGQSLYLAASRAPGIWHVEALGPEHLEKDVAVPWRRPFAAKWKTQLYEGDTRTTFTFRDSPGQIWRGVPGSYQYPAWFDGEAAFLRLSKKVPPKGEALVYFVEGSGTPDSVATPVELLKATLGREFCQSLLDPVGRGLRTHHRRGGVGVRRACTCGCTDAIQAVFEAGAEVEKQEYVQGAVDDMLYFVQRHVARIAEYRAFADDVLRRLRARRRAAPELKAFVARLEPLAERIPQECRVQQANMKTLAYADELARRTLALAARKDAQNLAAYKKLLDAWRAMGGAQDYVVAQCHTITRRLFQEAGYGCLDQPNAVELAQEIRARCRACLRNPDGYEVWPDY